MVEPMFRAELASTLKPGDLYILRGAEAKHAVAVRRMRSGEAIQVGDGQGFRIRGSIASINGNEVTISIVEARNDTIDAVRITLIQALAKGDRDELAIQAATELGISSVIPWQADRSISRWDGPKIAKGVERWRAICIEAAKQSLSATDPLVEQPASSSALINRFGDFDHVLVLEPATQVSLAEQLPLVGKVALVVGPEGGISESELEQFSAAGAKLTKLGESVLRTSTAGIAAISAIRFGR